MLLTDLGRSVEADETASFAIQILQDLDHKTEEFATQVNLLRALMPTGHLPRIKELIDRCWIRLKLTTSKAMHQSSKSGKQDCCGQRATTRKQKNS